MRSVITKIILFLLLIVVVAQIPFAYRRWQYAQVRDTIIATQTRNLIERPYDEYVGVIHAHTSLGGHSTGTFDELISGANTAGLDFVLLTEHWSENYDTCALTLNGQIGRTLFIGGNEIDTADGDRMLMIPGGPDAAGLRQMSTAAVIDKLHAEKRLVLITYPEKFNSWNTPFDGDEVFSMNTAQKDMSRFMLLLDYIWSGRTYPELLFAKRFSRPDSNLAKFDEVANQRPIVLFAAPDAHSNVGFHVFGDDAGNKWPSIKLDPYWLSFSIFRVHVLLPNGTALTRENLLDAIAKGHFYTGLDALGDTSGFGLSAGDRTFGDEVAASGVSTLTVTVPIACRVVTFKNGVRYDEQTNTGQVAIKADGPGTYRVEVYRDDLGADFSRMPWIMSNPIYLR